MSVDECSIVMLAYLFFRKGQELESKWFILIELDYFFLTKLLDHAWIKNLRLPNKFNILILFWYLSPFQDREMSTL